MRRGLFWLFGMLPSLALAGPDAPIQWAPEGGWIAYTVATPAGRPTPVPGWIFGEPDSPADRTVPPDAAPSPLRYRLYAADALGGDGVVLEDTRNPLTSPAWSPDGHMLAFGRLVVGAAGPARFEVVVQDGLSHQRVLLSRPASGDAASPEGYPARTLAWSPDGRYLAVPAPAAGGGLLIVRADNGRVLKTLDAAAWPSWSPDASKLAMIATGRSSSLVVMETGFGPPRLYADLGRTYQAPLWARDGRSLLAVSRRSFERGLGQTRQVDLLRILPESGQVETAAQLASDPLHRDKPVRGASFTTDRDAEDVFFSVDQEGQPPSVVWFRPKTLETVTRFHPVGEVSIRVGSLGLAPNGKLLAVRLGPDEAGATLALWDPASVRDPSVKAVRLLTPDDATRLDWVSLLVTTAQGLLRQVLPNPVVQGRGVARPTVLPVPGEIPSNQEVRLRLQRIGRLGRPLCDRPAGSEKADPRVDDYLAEARLFFDVLGEDFAAALASLEAVEARTTAPDRLVRLLAVRAQLLAGLGDLDGAGDVIAYLRSLDERVPTRVETTAAGVALTPEPPATNGWPRYLAQRLDDLAKSRRAQAGRPGEDDRPGVEPPWPGPRFGPPVGPDPGGVVFPLNRGAAMDPAGRVDDVPDVRVRFIPGRPFRR
jgi:hypothetical protein